MSESEYVPTVFVKGNSERVANSPREAVSLAFEGFKRKVAAVLATAAPARSVEADPDEVEAVKPFVTPRPSPASFRKFTDKNDEDKS